MTKQMRSMSCVVCNSYHKRNGCSICGVSICGSRTDRSMDCWHAHCKEAGHTHFIEEVFKEKSKNKGKKR